MWSDGRKYVGDWIQNKMDGSGVFDYNYIIQDFYLE
jgi:hypothetical protein